MEKKTWVTPELTVLVRSNPEEAVLTACKPVGAAGPNGNFNVCTNFDCNDICYAEAGS